MTKAPSFLRSFPKNIFCGFVVSLIALPLGLGLASACGAPPVSGVISAIVGGIVLSIFGGSHVTIAGPGNGLVVILLSAITTLGSGNLQQGYLYTLAAIVLSGFLLLLLGFLRMGSLSDFFPSAAIQGMLSAIGVGIFAKQFYVMLGNEGSGDTLSLLSKIPQEIYDYFTLSDASIFYAGFIGILSLLFIVFYNKISNPILKFLPAPMWIVLLSIGFYYYHFFNNRSYPIDATLLVSLPDDFLNNLVFPDFTKVFEWDFIAVVLSIALVASIESLLSIKAVDQLDPFRRRSHVNKDLKALGLASVLSGFLGGLNVVTVIARSSVNVNQGATNRSSNFFHALFLLLFLLLFSRVLHRLPLSALAAILVFTGYKLADPQNIMRVFKVGKEALLIFMSTLLFTLLTNLIAGIFCGMLVTFCVHIFATKRLGLFLRNFLKPNVLMYQEADTGVYYVSILHFCSFLNYYKLKHKLEQLPFSARVVVDFSLCRFVDQTVMEHLEAYGSSFEIGLGHMEVLGLDLHHTQTAHPFALRIFRQEAPLPVKKHLTRRQLALRSVARQVGWEYKSFAPVPLECFKESHYFEGKHVDMVKNLLSHSDFMLCDVIYNKGLFIAREWLRTTLLHIRCKGVVPDFTLDKEGLFERLRYLGNKQVHLHNYPDFSHRFHLYGEDVQAISDFFSKELVCFLESNDYYHIESTMRGLLVLKHQRLSSIPEVKSLIDFGKRLHQLLPFA